jgi:hypothetical protein
MLRILPLITALPLLLAVGLAEGFWTNRWGSSAELEAAAARLADVPLNVGEWEGEARELDERQITKAGIRGYLLRRYLHRSTGSTLTILLVCGPPGPVSVHTPDVCYSGAGYALTAAPVRQSLAGDAIDPAPDFLSARFRKQGAIVPEFLRIRWSWTTTGRWQAPDNPRFAFAGSSHLYKMYLIHQPIGSEERPEDDPTESFLRSFLPKMQRALFPR